MEDTGFQRENYPLHRVHADTWDGHIFLNLSAGQPQPLAAQSILRDAETEAVLHDMASPLIAWPFHQLECCPVNDGGDAIS